MVSILDKTLSRLTEQSKKKFVIRKNDHIFLLFTMQKKISENKILKMNGI